MAHKKGVGSSSNGRDSKPKYLGCKKFDQQHVLAGNILVRQRGTRIVAGQNVGMGRDHTLYTKITGWVRYDFFSKTHHRVSVFADRAMATAPKSGALKAAAAKS